MTTTNTWLTPLAVDWLGLGVGPGVGAVGSPGEAGGLGSGLGDGVGVADGLGVGDGVGDGVVVGVAVGDGDGVGVGDGVRAGVGTEGNVGSAITSCGGLDPSRLEKLRPSGLVELTLNEYDPLAVTPLIGVLIHVPLGAAGSEPTWTPLGGAVLHVTLASAKAEVAYTFGPVTDESVTNTRSVTLEPRV